MGNEALESIKHQVQQFVTDKKRPPLTLTTLKKLDYGIKIIVLIVLNFFNPAHKI